MSTKKRWLIIILLPLLAAILINAADLYKRAGKSLSLFNQVYKQLLANYVDEINPEKFIEVTIQNMLKELDPYTVYITKEDRFSLDVLTRGKYGGVGIQIGMRDGKLTVISPMDGTPAFRQGIRPGDIIIAVDSVKTKDLSLDEAARMIRGKIGSSVTLHIKRPGINEELTFTLKREEIKVHDINYAGVIDNVGYIRLINFSRNSPDELRDTIKKLKRENISGLILDLRNNPGGLLNAAIKTLELFTEKGDTLLFTKGRTKQSNRFFISRSKPLLGYKTPLVVLINSGSASASEIVAGAIQDLDRGIIVGERSFGKGLVQTLVNLPEENALKITTAKYYIPSHRLIQRQDYFSRNEVIAYDPPEDTLFHTRNGRLVRGGGGITPDFIVKPASYPLLVQSLIQNNLFFRFALHYKASHEKAPETISDNLYQEFITFVKQNDFSYQTDDEKKLEQIKKNLEDDSLSVNINQLFAPLFSEFERRKADDFQQYRSEVTRMLLMELTAIYEGTAGRIRASLPEDPVVQKALEIIRDQNTYYSTLQPNGRN